MADDVTLQSATPATPPAGMVIATDQEGASRHHQSVKVQLGSEGNFRGYLDSKTVTTLAASAVRAATFTSASVAQIVGDGVMFLLDVTVEAAGETLSLKIQVLDPVGGSSWVDLVDFGTIYTSASESPTTKIAVAARGVADADYVSAVIAKSVAIPLTWRAVVTHSSSGNWTYSLAAVAL